MISCTVTSTSHTAGQSSECTSGRTTQLSYGTTYHWQVQAYVSTPLRNGEFSQKWTFYTVLAPPQLQGPRNGATGQSLTPTLSWNPVPEANRYWVLVATSPDVFPTDLQATTCRGCLAAGYTDSTTYTWGDPFPKGVSQGSTNPPGALAPATTYYWKVQGFPSGSKRMGEYSQVWSFTTTQPSPAPRSPTPTATPTASPTPRGKRPLIFIPGIMGTEIVDGNNKLWFSLNNCDITKLRPDDSGVPQVGRPGSLLWSVASYYDVYGDFSNYLNSNATNNQLHLFPYDWRLNLQTVAAQLAGLIAALVNHTGHQQVDIVAHSMGGLVAKWFLSQSGNEKRVRRLITIGTPHLGTPDAVRVLLEGKPMSFGLLEREPVRAYAARNMPSAYQLAPGKQYLGLQGSYVDIYQDIYQIDTCERLGNSGKSGSLREVRDLWWKHEACTYCPSGWWDTCADRWETLNPKALDWLDARQALDTWSPPSGVTAYALYGYGESTITKLVVSQSGGTGYVCGKDWGDGDGTVVLKSAEGVNGWQGLFGFKKAEHLALVRNQAVRECTIALLADTPDTTKCQGGRAAEMRQEGQVPMRLDVALYGEGVRLRVVDGAGRVTGYLPGGEGEGEVTMEIEGSRFDRFILFQSALVELQPLRIEAESERAGELMLRLRVLEEYEVVQEAVYRFGVEAGGKGVLEIEQEALGRRMKSAQGRGVVGRQQPYGLSLAPLQVDRDGDGTMEVEVDGLEVPVANGGEDQVVGSGDVVLLDGSASRDSLGRALEYEWVQTAGPEVELEGARTAVARFVAPRVEEETVLSFSLVVRAGGVESQADVVGVVVRPCGQERCNGVDDDCDGLVDEDDPEEGGVCRLAGAGKCEFGTLQCRGGRLQCVAGFAECERTGCSSDADCDDGVFCNGLERCVDRLLCSPGPVPCPGACEQCDEQQQRCLPVANCQAQSTVCAGDCNNDRDVTIDELLRMVNVALELQSLAACTPGDTNHDGTITVDEIIAAVNRALSGC